MELSELKDLLTFHYHTLLLYCSLCALGNIGVSHALCSYIDQSQLLHAVQDPCLPGPLRSAYYQLLTQVIFAVTLSFNWVFFIYCKYELIVIYVPQVYLSNHTEARVMMNHEYIVPMTDQTREITLYPCAESDDNGRSDIPSSSLSTSLKPQVHFTCPCFIRGNREDGDCTEEIDSTHSPEIPLVILKDLTVDMLSVGVCAVSQDVSDPIGGSIELMLVPLVRLVHTLLVLGVFGDEDLGKVLKLIEPTVFSTDTHTILPNTIKQEKANEAPTQGLLQIRLPEAVKLEVNKPQLFYMFHHPFKISHNLLLLLFFIFQLCHLLSYLCDCQMRHRVEAVVAFSDNFVRRLQENQRSRYNEVMQALNMSAALTARKTKEFRSPPEEQVQKNYSSVSSFRL